MREKTTSPDVIRLAKIAFPEYRGRKFYRCEAETVNCRSYWDGGSRSYFAFVRTDTFQVLPMPTSHPFFDHVAPSVESLPIPSGAVCVERSIFCGKEAGCTVYFRAAPALTA